MLEVLHQCVPVGKPAGSWIDSTIRQYDESLAPSRALMPVSGLGRGRRERRDGGVWFPRPAVHLRCISSSLTSDFCVGIAHLDLG